MGDSPLRNLPSVDRLLSDPALSGVAGHDAVRDACRAVLADARTNGVPDTQELVQRVSQRIADQKRMHLRYAINATGVVLHTGLGRARLCDSARRAVEDAARGHAVLEIDAETGERGSRQTVFRELLRRLTGAEDAFVCNNNAAAVMLCVNTLASGREAILSRGQSVEIGGSFRMPDVIRSAGATLVEVGTTNKTRLSDYQKAIGPATGCVIRCHPSNFQVVGFTEEVPAREMAGLSIPVIDDVGSGCLVDTAMFGLPHEPTLGEAVASGVGLVTASGDKLLGGPQAGLVLGKRELVKRLSKNPLARAVRCDKLTLAALEATLREYLDPERALRSIPTLRYLGRTLPELRSMAETLAGMIGGEVIQGRSEVGGGSLPGSELPSFLVALDGPPMELAHKLRTGDPPIFARIVDDRVCLDVRTLEENEFLAIHTALS